MKFPVPAYGVVPPEADTVMVVVPPKQAIVPALFDEVSAAGSVTVAVAVVWHPKASVTLMLYVPAARFEKMLPVWYVTPLFILY